MRSKVYESQSIKKPISIPLTLIQIFSIGNWLINIINYKRCYKWFSLIMFL